MSLILNLLSRDKNSASPLKVGVEIERYGFDRAGQLLRYSQQIRPVFQEMIQQKAWKAAYTVGSEILAIEKEGDQWSLEPGSQLELSARPSLHLQDLESLQERREQELLSCAAAQGWAYEWLAVNPYESASSIQIIPSPRYAIMTQYFQELGGRGLDMMRLTSGCHVNLDYWSAKHGIQQMRVGAYLAPVFIACFGNSPFFERKSTGRFAERIAIWQKTDALRSGIPPGLFDSAFNMSSYVNLVESTPLMFYFDENGVAHPAAGRAWQDLSSALQETNALTAIRQLFYDVRLKPCCVELRFLDQNEPSVRMASFALMLGLLQDEKNLQELDQEASRATIENVLRATDLASKKALTEHSFVLQAQSLLKRAELGLWRRGFGEEKFLAPLDQILKNRKNPAQTLLEEGGFERFEENSIRRRSR